MMRLLAADQTGAGVVERSRHLELFVCWAVQAALNILYGIPKQLAPTNSLAFTSIIFSILMRSDAWL